MTSEKAETRRRYSAAMKAQVVAACDEFGASVAAWVVLGESMSLLQGLAMALVQMMMGLGAPFAGGLIDKFRWQCAVVRIARIRGAVSSNNQWAAVLCSNQAADGMNCHVVEEYGDGASA